MADDKRPSIADTEVKQYLIKVKGGKDSDAIAVSSVDAKEAVAGGTHVYVGNKPAGVASWLGDSVLQDAVNDSRSLKTKAERLEAEGESLTPELELRKDLDEINNLTSKEISALMKEREIEIPGFSGFNIKQKREALIEVLSVKAEVPEEVEELTEVEETADEQVEETTEETPTDQDEEVSETEGEEEL